MDPQTLTGTTNWREFTDHDALNDRLATELATDTGEW
jgi:hypothetical protein